MIFKLQILSMQIAICLFILLISVLVLNHIMPIEIACCNSGFHLDCFHVAAMYTDCDWRYCILLVYRSFGIDSKALMMAKTIKPEIIVIIVINMVSLTLFYAQFPYDGGIRHCSPHISFFSLHSIIIYAFMVSVV